jgi:hypothetical protein
MRILALVVMVLGFLFVWGGFTRNDPELDYCPTLLELHGATVDPQWWPPGTIRCDITKGDEVVESKTTFPAGDYLMVVLIGLAVAVLRPRPLRILASFALFFAGVAVFFL